MNAPAQSLAKRLPTDMVGSYTSASAINARLEAASEQAHLVSPMTSVGALPPGWAVAITSVMVDAASETYATGGGKKGLSKVALDRIAAASGISWDPGASGRLDDGSHPHYCEWRAVGHIRNFDGTTRSIVGSKRMALRDGDPDALALKPNELAQQRRFIAEHAETKARLRAVRSIGVATGYSERDLQKPFVIAQLMFTGRVPGNPELEAALTLRLADAALGGRQALYGSAAAAPRALEAPKAAPRLPPPPVGSVQDDDDDLPDSWQQSSSPAPRVEQRQAQPAQAQRQREPGDDDAEPPQRQPSGLSIPGGKEKGVAIEDASDSSLEYWVGRISASLDAGESRNAARDQQLVDAMRTEMEARR